MQIEKENTGELPENMPDPVEQDLNVEMTEEEIRLEDETRLDEAAEEDYSVLNKPDLIEKLKEILSKEDADSQRSTVARLRDAFKNLTREEIEEKKKLFQEQKEEEDEEFEYRNPLDDQFETFVKDYNQKRADQKKKKERALNENLKQKKEILEALKTLPENTTNIAAGFEKLQSLQTLWRSIGPVPTGMADNLWKNYQFYVGKFYEGVKLSNELKDLDRKKNLDLKNEIIERAEKLESEPSIRKALDQLQQLNEEWRQIGLASKETNDALWEKFKNAADKIYQRKKDYQAQASEKQQKNLEGKLALIDQLQNIVLAEYSSHKEWLEGQKKIDDLLEQWKKIGFTPSSEKGEAWKKFKSLRQQFQDKKDEFYSEKRGEEKENLKVKEELSKQAEALIESTDWRGTTEKLKELQLKWKEVGPVPRKVSDKIWKRFRSACDQFFANKAKHFEGQMGQLNENVKQREEFIRTLEQFEPAEDQKQNLESLKEFQSKWNGFGEMPHAQKERLNKAFRIAISSVMEKIKGKAGDNSKMFIQLKYEQMSQSAEGKKQIEQERYALQGKIKRLETEVNTLENNLSFFGRSKNADAMKAEFQQKIDAGREEIKKLKDQLKMIPRIERA